MIPSNPGITLRWMTSLLIFAAAGCTIAPIETGIGDGISDEIDIETTPPSREAAEHAMPDRDPTVQDEISQEPNSISSEAADLTVETDNAETPSASDIDGQEGVLDLDQVDVSELRPWAFHGRLDLAYVNFPDTRNVDGYRSGQVLPISPAVYFEYRLLDWLFVVAEVEYDGREEQIEIDQALLRIDAIEDLLTLRVGRHYFPFGLERLYYSPSRNTLVDRPAAFRQVFPGTYADNGLFVEGKYTHHTAWSLGYEAAVSQGLRGFERDDIPETLDDNNNTPFVGGRAYFQPRRELTFGASYMTGYWDANDENLLDFFGFDANLKLFEFDLRVEYVGSQVQDTEEFASFFRQGWYFHIEKTFEFEAKYLYALVPVFRVDWIDSNNAIRNHLDLTRYSVGLATFFLENLQWKLEYSVNDERGDDISNNGFLTQVVFHW